MSITIKALAIEIAAKTGDSLDNARAGVQVLADQIVGIDGPAAMDGDRLTDETADLIRAQYQPESEWSSYPHGRLTDYVTGAVIRPATFDEWQRSIAVVESGNASGAFTIDRDGEPCPADADESVFGPTRCVFVA